MTVSNECSSVRGGKGQGLLADWTLEEAAEELKTREAGLQLRQLGVSYRGLLSKGAGPAWKTGFDGPGYLTRRCLVEVGLGAGVPGW